MITAQYSVVSIKRTVHLACQGLIHGIFSYDLCKGSRSRPLSIHHDANISYTNFEMLYMYVFRSKLELLFNSDF